MNWNNKNIEDLDKEDHDKENHNKDESGIIQELVESKKCQWFWEI